MINNTTIKAGIANNIVNTNKNSQYAIIPKTPKIDEKIEPIKPKIIM